MDKSLEDNEYYRALARFFLKRIMLEKYKKEIIIGMLILIPAGIFETYFIPEYKPNPDLPASIRQVVPSMEIPSSLASSGTVSNLS